MDTFQAFLETMIDNADMERFTDNGLLRLVRIYHSNEIPVPATVTSQVAARGLIL